MKKILMIILCLITLLCYASCGSETKPAEAPATPGTATPGTAAPVDSAPASPETAAPETVAPKSGIDVDLTDMNSTMVYSEVYNMVNEPEKYVGKTVKMKGQFNASYYEGTGNYYYYVIIADATACCAQGLEFVWSGDHTYPEDYPENGDEVIVTGVYGQYDELGVTYNYIATDNIEVVGA